MPFKQIISNDNLPIDKDGKPAHVPLKVNVVKIYRWQCPHCLRDNMETEVHKDGLLFCKCTRVLQISSIENDKIFYLNDSSNGECYLLKFDDTEKPDEIYTDAKAALERFNKAKDMWTCQLFGILMEG